ncbi:hypothetical protein JMJ35_009982 [Cladonia borealis]|uniref:Uncharacterized protein n=1 Tax=Cladonia borealis TaxID=184061 RepID=A0AA39QS73_9LECA|nr:hypothetical protein JMJ35_009982 [Cladonia borealis]
MDFLERMGEQVGERYLMNKANAAPQQLENLVKKQFKGGAAEPEGAGNGGKTAAAASSEHGGAKASEVGTSKKDEEIARLRAQLAQTKLEKGAVTAAAKKGSSTGKANTKTKELEELGAGAGITTGLNGRKQLEAPKEMKGLKALGAGAAASKASKASKGKSESASPSRRLSVASRAARQELPPLSIVARKPKSGKKAEGLATLTGAGVGAKQSSKSEEDHGSEASSSLSRRHSISSNLKHETESNAAGHTEKPRRSKSVKQHSEDGSSAHSIASSRRPAKHSSEHGSEASGISPFQKPFRQITEHGGGGGHSIAPSRHPPSLHGSQAYSSTPSRPPTEYGHRKGVNGYAVPSESSSLVRYIPKEESEVGRGELHVVVVEDEEDVPIRRNSVNERGGGVVKLSSRQGRTVYMVR